MKNISHILWDWNGTLVNDVDLCLNVTNGLLQNKKLTPISKERYLAEFTFPVINFYRAISFEFDEKSYHEVADNWISQYKSNFAQQSSLNGDVINSLNAVKDLGFRQSIFSACETSLLHHSIHHLKLQEFFHTIHGTDNNKAHGKEDLARQIIADEHVNPEESLLFGDTLHDFEVAENTGLKCVLIANGHQCEKRLRKSTATILRHIGEVPAFLKSLQ